MCAYTLSADADCVYIYVRQLLKLNLSACVHAFNKPLMGLWVSRGALLFSCCTHKYTHTHTGSVSLARAQARVRVARCPSWPKRVVSTSCGAVHFLPFTSLDHVKKRYRRYAEWVRSRKIVCPKFPQPIIPFRLTIVQLYWPWVWRINWDAKGGARNRIMQTYAFQSEADVQTVYSGHLTCVAASQDQDRAAAAPLKVLTFPLPNQLSLHRKQVRGRRFSPQVRTVQLRLYSCIAQCGGPSILARAIILPARTAISFRDLTCYEYYVHFLWREITCWPTYIVQSYCSCHSTTGGWINYCILWEIPTVSHSPLLYPLSSTVKGHFQVLWSPQE